MNMQELNRFSVFTEIIFGMHSSGQLGQECKRLGATKVAVVTDSVVAAILDEALDSFGKSGLPYVVYDQATADPTDEDINRAAIFLKEEGCDCVVTAGGGSALCTGKGAAFMATNEGSIVDYEEKGKRRRPSLPCIAIPTTAGSGSEVSKITPITNSKTNIKSGIFGDAPRVALLDPLLLKTVPRGQAVASGVDALTHCVESFTSKKATPLTDCIALKGMEMIGRSFCSSVLGDDLNAKGEMLFASMVANIACGSAGLGLSHALNGGLTYLYRARGYKPVAYGDLHAICLPLVMEFNLPAAEEKFAHMALALGADGKGDRRETAMKSITRVKEVFTTLNTLYKLPWEAIPSDEMEAVAELTLNTPLAEVNPRRASKAEAVSLIQKALEGWR
ncbi:MAG: iron-containing alcohol dehydrogenase [Pseudomonadota bacterium]